MDVYEFLNSANDLSGVTVSIFDCDSQETVYTSRGSEDVLADVQYNGFDDYEVESFDLFIDRDGHLCMELNISMGDDEE